MSFDVLTKDKATQSTLFLIKKFKSTLSFFVVDCKFNSVLGKFTPFFEYNFPPLIISQVNMSFDILFTLNLIFPSSIRTISLCFKSVVNLL